MTKADARWVARHHERPGMSAEYPEMTAENYDFADFFAPAPHAGSFEPSPQLRGR